MIRKVIWVFLFFAVSLCIPGNESLAQNIFERTEILAKDRPEAWAMKLVGSELMMTSMEVPRYGKPWRFDLGIETGWIPSLDAEQRMIGFNGTKEEDVNRTPIFGRPRVLVGLPQHFSAGLGYLPPVDIGGVRPNLFTWSVDRPVLSRSWWRLGGRIYGEVGHLKGDITCSADTVAAGNDPVRNPFGCEVPSKDTMRIRSVGVELGNAFAIPHHLEPFVSAGWNYFSNEFQVNAQYSGLIDQSLLTTSGPTFSLITGIAWRPASKVRISGEFFFTPLDVRRQGVRTSDDLLNVRAGLFYSIR